MLGARNQREALGVLDGLEREIDVENRPVKVIVAWTLEVKNVCDWRPPEPGKMLEGDEEFSVPEKNPKTVRGDVLNGRLKSGGFKLFGFCAHGGFLAPQIYPHLFLAKPNFFLVLFLGRSLAFLCHVAVADSPC